MSVELSEEDYSPKNRLKLEKVRDYSSVKSEASEEAHALSSTQKNVKVSRKQVKGERTGEP